MLFFIATIAFATDPHAPVPNLRNDHPERLSPLDLDLRALLKFLGVSTSRDRAAILRRNGILTSHEHINSPCEWEGVQCANNRISQIFWRFPESGPARCRCGGFDASWLPGAITRVDTSRQASMKAFDTRRLPPSLELIAMESCMLSGSVDMCALPPNLVWFRLARNALAGTVWLTRLPKKLQKVELHQNMFTELYVLGAAIPETVKVLDFRSQMGEASIDVVYLDDHDYTWKVEV